jgi:hypothetical protein
MESMRGHRVSQMPVHGVNEGSQGLPDASAWIQGIVQEWACNLSTMCRHEPRSTENVAAVFAKPDDLNRSWTELLAMQTRAMGNGQLTIAPT